MIFQNIDFHNVAELVPDGKGYRMLRFPAELSHRMDDGADRISMMSTGIELRFKMKSDSVILHLKADPALEAQVAYIYYGVFQGCWEYSSKMILTEDTAVEIAHPKNLDTLKMLSQQYHSSFNPEVVRVVLPYGNCCFIDVEGEIEVPEKGDYPQECYLAYGSSITHGSLALAAPYTYPFRIAQKLGCDYINLGMAGSARAELPMAKYISARRDWDFASIELGINMLKRFSETEFEVRVNDFIEIMAKDGRPVFVTSIFGFVGDDQEKAAAFRGIVSACVAKWQKTYPQSRLYFTDGLELLSSPMHVSQDFVHPSLEGMNQIVEKWYGVMEETLK